MSWRLVTLGVFMSAVSSRRNKAQVAQVPPIDPKFNPHVSPTSRWAAVRAVLSGVRMFVAAIGIVLMILFAHTIYLEGTGQMVSIRACVPVIAGAVVDRQRLLKELGRLREEELRDYAALPPRQEDVR
jgi:hypothetical protein